MKNLKLVNSTKELNALVLSTKDFLESATWYFEYCSYKGSEDEKICNYMEGRKVSAKSIKDMLVDYLDDMDELTEVENPAKYCARWIANEVAYSHTNHFGWELGETTSIVLQ